MLMLNWGAPQNHGYFFTKKYQKQIYSLNNNKKLTKTFYFFYNHNKLKTWFLKAHLFCINYFFRVGL